MNPDLAQSLEPLHRDAYGWALHCCIDGACGASDVLQTAYLKVMQGKARHSGGATLKTWWFGVIRFTAREEARRRRFRESLGGKILLFDSVETREAPSRLELDEESAALKRCLAQLPARQAEVLHLVFYQDLSLSEAAVVMSISLGSARTHYDRAKTRMRELLAPTRVES